LRCEPTLPLQGRVKAGFVVIQAFHFIIGDSPDFIRGFIRPSLAGAGLIVIAAPDQTGAIIPSWTGFSG
jgi:hypothetical protein